MRTNELQKNYEIGISWLAFPLHPEIPKEGCTLEELFAGRAVDLAKMMGRLKQVADELGLPIVARNKTYNTRLAQELAKWAESQGRGEEFNEAVFRAYFVDGKNIGNEDELVGLAKLLGLAEKEARSVLELRTFEQAVAADWQRAYETGITAVPTFVINGKAVVGAQPYEILEKFLNLNNAKKRV